ncbi:MAG TPA: hypothetical protein VMW91_03390 [Desulfosporosinus sp.]|nr:hypothetical protein [Desulfosporosinus sp.]
MNYKQANLIHKIDGGLIILTIILGFTAAFTALPFWVALIPLLISFTIDALFLRKLKRLQSGYVYDDDECEEV